MTFPDVTGAVLAGGEGTRLGKVRKGLLRLDGEPLMARTLRVLRDLFPANVVIANEVAPYALFGAPILGDPIPDHGAPGGLFAALSGARTPWVFLCACDMPALDPRVITALALRRGGSALACVAVVDGRPEPTHGFWSAAVAQTLESLLRSGDPSFKDLLQAVPSVQVPVEELAAEIPGAERSFANVNTPEDLAAWGIVRPGG